MCVTFNDRVLYVRCVCCIRGRGTVCKVCVCYIGGGVPYVRCGFVIFGEDKVCKVCVISGKRVLYARCVCYV